MASVFKMRVPEAGEGGGDFEVVPAGSLGAVVVGVIDIGTQERTYNNETEEARKVVIVWELTGERYEAKGRNHFVGRDYTLSLHENANLRKMLESWRGKAFGDKEPFDLDTILGKPCLVNIVHKTTKTTNRSFARVDNVSRPPKGMEVKPRTVEPISWSVDDGDVKQLAALDWLPFFYGKPLAEAAAKSNELAGRAARPNPGPSGDADEPEDDQTESGDIPF